MLPITQGKKTPVPQDGVPTLAPAPPDPPRKTALIFEGPCWLFSHRFEDKLAIGGEALNPPLASDPT